MSCSFSRLFPWFLPLLLSLCSIASAADSRPETTPAPTQKEVSKISVNVFGSVAKPGAYALSPNSTLLDALGAAGGWGTLANKAKVSILSGPAGEKPSITIYDVDAILQGKAVNPKLQDHDSIVVTERVF